MKFFLSLLIVSLLLFLASCEIEKQHEQDLINYQRESIFLSYTEVYRDTIRSRDVWIDSFTIQQEGYETYPYSAETIWNCNKMQVQRQGDTIFLQAFKYTPPDTNFRTKFECLETFDRFVVDKNGKGIHQGLPLEWDPNVRVHGDSLLFDMTIVFLDRGPASLAGMPSLIRYPQYGTFTNIDSLSVVIQDVYDDSPDLIESPKFKVAWQTWVYLHK